MAGSDTDCEYESGAPGPSSEMKLRKETTFVRTYSRQYFKTSETQSTDNVSRRVNEEPKTSAERGREFRARKKLRKQQIKQQQQTYTIFEIATEDNQVPEPPSKKQAKTAAQRMREYRERKKFKNPSGNNEEQSDLRDATLTLKYDDITNHKKAHEIFNQKFRKNPFGYSCTVCNRLWFKNDLKKASHTYEDLLKKITNTNNINDAMICSTCKDALDKQNIPILSTYNGFKFPKTPAHLPKLDLISERLISPRLPFMQIRRLRHVHGQFDICGQIINVPVSVDTMANQLPRDISDDHCINVHIKRKRIHKSSYLQGLVNKKNIKTWLQYLMNTPLYTHYNLTINREFRSDHDEESQQIGNIDEVSEDITIEESLTAQQHTLLWNDKKYLRIALGEYNSPRSLLIDEHAEELSFPTIYLGQFRTFKENIRVTPFMMASSELRCTDRRAITPYHLLYIAVKIMRMRIRDCLTVTFKHIGPNTNITKEQIQSDEYINDCIETNLAFLRSIPNSTWYWAQRKKDLFAMIRQKGKPTAFMTLSANEIGWTDLIQLLYKLANNGTDISERVASELSFIEKSTLVNEDAVTCAIYFNKLVNVLLTILQSKQCSPFGRYRVAEYFKRIEFQHCGSPHAHILLWLENAPDNMIDENNRKVIHLIDSLVSVSASQASENIKLQTHKHTCTCYKKMFANKPQKCRFGAPFMPCRKTLNLTPMQKTDEHFQRYAKRYVEIRSNLESTDYNNIDDFYAKNNIQSDGEYRNILRAGITRPKIFYKRSPTEIWHNPFNPFVFSILRSNMDFQIITDEYSCAAYVVEYVNKTNRGVSNLQRKIVEVMHEHPEFDIVDITRKMSVDMLNSVEMSSQEAAWYLLRAPMSKSSVDVIYINTVWPVERQRIRKTQKELSELDENSTDIWKEDWFDKYQQRPDELSNITLAQFVSKYYQKKSGVYAVRIEPKVIRFRNYDIAQDYNEYRREMVTLHIPFRNEDAEILNEMKFINMYDENEALIVERRKEFESNLDIEKTIEICRQLCREDGNPDDEETEIQNDANRFPEPNPFQQLYHNPNADVNMDLHLAASDSIRNEKSILKSVTSIVDGTLSLGTQRLEQIHFLEMVMYEYLERTLYHNIPVEDANFQKKAEQVKDCMAILKFNTSYEWLIYFKKKYGLKDFSKETLRIRLQLKEEKRSSLDPVDMVRYVQQQRRILHKSQRNVPTYINQTQVRDYTPNDVNESRPTTDMSTQHLKKDNNPTIVYEGADEYPVHSDFAVDVATVKLEIAPTQLSDYNGPRPIPKNITIAVPVDPKTNDNQQDASDDDKLSPQKSAVHDIILESDSEDNEYSTIYEIIDDEAPSTPVADNHICSSPPFPSNIENYSLETDKHNFNESSSSPRPSLLNVENDSQEGDISPNIGDSITIKTEPPSNDHEQMDTTDEQILTFILAEDDVIIKTQASPSPLIDEKDTKLRSGVERSLNYVMGHTQPHSNSSSLPPADELDEDSKPTIIVNNGEELIIENKNGATDHHQPSSSVPCKRNRPNSPLPDIDTLEEAMRHLKVLENYVMMKENFRAIGLITQLEDAIKKTPKQ